MSTIPDVSCVEWAKSSYSGDGGANCVEWAPTYAPTGIVPVRDSKVSDGPALTFVPSAWSSFVTAVRQAEFGAV
jgi:hypothetical protein